MGYPDPQHPGQHPGDQNYPATPSAPRPTRQYERSEYGADLAGEPQGPPPLPQGPALQPGPGPVGPQGPGHGAGYGAQQEPPTQAYDGGYQLGYAPGGPGVQYGGGVPPTGPPQGPGGPGGGSGGGDGSGGGNKKLLWIAVAAVVLVLVLAVIVVLVATGGTKSTSASSTGTTQTTTVPTTTRSGIALPTGLPSGISIPPIYGGSTTGANAKKWVVEVTGSGSAQVIAVGIPDTNTLGSQTLPWTKSFTADTFLVTVTVFSPKPDMACRITRDGAVVAEEKASSGPLICTATGS
ncbi:hypothetical protein [Tsukamurella sp. NPDC003166]|uniref:hypothetical protein n=1 Tax=Tsukamurella sp. NPDC003166 TaxID=3154444 RepID=UPI0033B2D54D